MAGYSNRKNIMLLQAAVHSVFAQLSDSLDQLSEGQYVRPSIILFDATIGQHVRHIIELFQCLEKGYDIGIVNYDDRTRDKRIETDKTFAAILLNEINKNLDKPNKSLVLELGSSNDFDEPLPVSTNYFREIIYNLEHTVHHMALVRVGINEVSDIILPKGYGVASSTIKFRNRCAQ